MSTIDVHSHVLPYIYLEALQTAGVTDIDGYPTPDWSLEDQPHYADPPADSREG